MGVQLTRLGLFLLLQFIMEEKLEVVVAYGRATDDRDEAATSLVRITDYSSRAVSFLSRLICTYQCGSTSRGATCGLAGAPETCAYCAHTV